MILVEDTRTSFAPGLRIKIKNRWPKKTKREFVHINETKEDFMIYPQTLPSLRAFSTFPRP